MNYSVLFDKLLIFLVLMVIGYVCARRGFLSPAFTRTASSLTINVFMCATIINAVLTADMSLRLSELGYMLALVCVMQLIGYGLAFAVSHFPIERQHRPEFELLMSMGNSMFIALPIVDGLFGPVAVFYVSLSCIPFNLLIYTYGVWRLKNGRGVGGLRVKDIASPPLVATLVSLLVILLRLPLPSAVRGLVSSMAGATMPLSMIVIGASMGSVGLLDAFRRPAFYLSSFVRLLLVPLVTWLLLRPLTGDPVLLMTLVITAACPSAVMISVLAIQYDRDGVFTSEGILHSTVLSVFTIPLVVWLLA